MLSVCFLFLVRWPLAVRSDKMDDCVYLSPRLLIFSSFANNLPRISATMNGVSVLLPSKVALLSEKAQQNKKAGSVV